MEPEDTGLAPLNSMGIPLGIAVEDQLGLRLPRVIRRNQERLREEK